MSHCSCEHCTQPLADRVRTGLLLGYPKCCVKAYAHYELGIPQDPVEQARVETLYSEELDWFESKMGWGKTKQTRRGIDVYIKGGLTHCCKMRDWSPCFTCQHIMLHTVLEGRHKMGLNRKGAFIRAASQIVTARRTWSIDNEPSMKELRTRFHEVSEKEVSALLQPRLT